MGAGPEEPGREPPPRPHGGTPGAAQEPARAAPPGAGSRRSPPRPALSRRRETRAPALAPLPGRPASTSGDLLGSATRWWKAARVPGDVLRRRPARWPRRPHSVSSVALPSVRRNLETEISEKVTLNWEPKHEKNNGMLFFKN